MPGRKTLVKRIRERLEEAGRLVPRSSWKPWHISFCSREGSQQPCCLALIPTVQGRGLGDVFLGGVDLVLAVVILVDILSFSESLCGMTVVVYGILVGEVEE
jgi:hypothetical protein